MNKPLQRGMVTLAEILPEIRIVAKPKPAAPEPEKSESPEIIAPRQKPPKVIGDPTRTPVNKTAAMMTARASWLSQPLPPERPPLAEIEKLREENAQLLAINENLKRENLALKRKLENLVKNKPIAPKKIALTLEIPARNMVPEMAPDLQARKQQILERLNHGR